MSSRSNTSSRSHASSRSSQSSRSHGSSRSSRPDTPYPLQQHHQKQRQRPPLSSINEENEIKNEYERLRIQAIDLERELQKKINTKALSRRTNALSKQNEEFKKNIKQLQKWMKEIEATKDENKEMLSFVLSHKESETLERTTAIKLGLLREDLYRKGIRMLVIREKFTKTASKQEKALLKPYRYDNYVLFGKMGYNREAFDEYLQKRRDAANEREREAKKTNEEEYKVKINNLKRKIGALKSKNKKLEDENQRLKNLLKEKKNNGVIGAIKSYFSNDSSDDSEASGESNENSGESNGAESNSGESNESNENSGDSNESNESNGAESNESENEESNESENEESNESEQKQVLFCFALSLCKHYPCAK